MHGLQYVGDGMKGGEVSHALRSCMFAGFGEKNHRRSSVPSPDEEAPSALGRTSSNLTPPVVPEFTDM